MNRNLILKFISIIAVSTVWIFIIPGYVAFKHNVFYGWQFKNKISEQTIVKNLVHENIEIYSTDITNQQNNHKLILKTTFAGFAENGLNYVWLESYIILLSYLLIIFNGGFSYLIDKRTIYITLMVIFLFNTPTWIRNFTSFGQIGRTIYTYVNFDIDKLSFFLQELRGYLFSFLLALYWGAFEKRAAQTFLKQSHFYKELDLKTYTKFALLAKRDFLNWQRDILLTIILFLPWTWFYWRNIYFHKDSRYIFPAIIFHAFWLISIIVVSRGFMMQNTSLWRYKNCIKLNLIETEKNDKSFTYIDCIEIIPKGQLLLTSITTIISVFSPFVQLAFKI